MKKTLERQGFGGFALYVKPEKYIKKEIKIPCSEEDLHELLAGKVFRWTFEGVRVKLYKEDN